MFVNYKISVIIITVFQNNNKHVTMKFDMKAKTDTQHFELCAPREILLQSAMFRLGNIEDQVQAGYNIIHKYHKTVTIFGSARLKETNEYYQAARAVARHLAKDNFTVITGGGGGIMEAGNRGAFEVGGSSVGFNIKLPHEQSLNDYTTDSYAFTHFAPRKIVMTLYADAYVYFPGGFGTLDELAEILTLIQTGKTVKAPVVLYGSKFWKPLDEFIKKELRDGEKVISRGDEKLYTITDDIEKVVKLVKSNRTYCDH